MSEHRPHLARSRVIATRYANAYFRSRLEARWAAFFDLCGWRWDNFGGKRALKSNG